MWMDAGVGHAMRISSCNKTQQPVVILIVRPYLIGTLPTHYVNVVRMQTE